MAATAPRVDWQFQLLDLRPGRPAPTLVPPPPPVEPGESEAFRTLRRVLDPALAARVRSGAELLRRAANNTERPEILPTTLAPLDALLGGGLERGKLVELVSRRAAGRFSIAMSALAAATSIGEAAALIDLGDHFDPQLAEANGVDLRRLLWVRPRTVKEAVMSAEMITATGFQLVVVDLGLHPIRGRRAPDAAWVRLARSAETARTAMLVSSPYPLTGTASEAVVKANGGRAKWSRGLLMGVEMTLTLEKHRHIKAGGKATVTLVVPEAEASLRVAESPSVRILEKTNAAPAASGVRERSSRSLSSGSSAAASRAVASLPHSRRADARDPLAGAEDDLAHSRLGDS